MAARGPQAAGIASVGGVKCVGVSQVHFLHVLVLSQPGPEMATVLSMHGSFV